MRTLGSRGRAGNAMFQYAFLRGYALSIGADIQTPDWWGRKVFPVAAADPLIDRMLPQTHCDSVTHRAGLPLFYFRGLTDIDVQGYMQHQAFLDTYSRAQALNWFKVSPEFDKYCPQSDAYSAMHLRRGDYTNDPHFRRLYCTVSELSYQRAIKQFGIPTPVIHIYEGAGAPIKELEDLGVPWLRDWLFLRGASHLLRSNSTFAWWAATLGNGKVYSPVVGKKVGHQTVPFVCGNHPNTAGVFPNQSDLVLQ